ncbi:DUF1636 domain-containing protein [Nisaea acidiphila]|uniref:DUF1636 domain-containing protein n=1 Tax=Nisaea acidiphila TaxID=1862145 RepID=A0A9J7AN10_9PROT|nr:DUF1636 domain-containing protein [Nisaea acidiphila]UUX48567.1 DUF1636 domain-containing protein [Nisaea acidiphila]
MSAAPAEIQICIECTHPHAGKRTAVTAGQRLLAATHDLLVAHPNAPEAVVRPVACLGNCRKRCRASILGPGRWSWSFGGLTPERGPAFLIDTLAAWHAAKSGLIPKPARSRELISKTLGRTAPLLPSPRKAQD